MSLLTLVIVLVVLGAALYVMNALIPMNPTIRTLLNALVIIIVALWLADAFGIANMHIGTRRGS